MHSMVRNQRRSFEVYAYLNIFRRMLVRLRHERCQSKTEFLGRTITDEEFVKIIADLNNFFNCIYWLYEGVTQYFDRWVSFS